MELGKAHPEFAQMYYGMKSGHLPASQQDIRQFEDSFKPQSQAEGNCEGLHPEYVEYCNFARSLGYSCKC